MLPNRKTMGPLPTTHMQISKAEVWCKGKEPLFKTYIVSKHPKKSNPVTLYQARPVSGCTWSYLSASNHKIPSSLGNRGPASRIPRWVSIEENRGADSCCQPSSNPRTEHGGPLVPIQLLPPFFSSWWARALGCLSTHPGYSP